MACSFATATVVSSTLKLLAAASPAAPHSFSVPRALSAAARPLRLAPPPDPPGPAPSLPAPAEWTICRWSGLGNKAPDFEVEAVFDQEFINVKLSDYIGKKYVILFFYPLDSTFVCPTEITAFSDRYEEFEKLNTEILGVLVDSVVCYNVLNC